MAAYIYIRELTYFLITCQVVETLPRSITISWVPPVLQEGVFAQIIDYVVQWTPIGSPSNVGQGNQFFTANTIFTLTGTFLAFLKSFCIQIDFSR